MIINLEDLKKPCTCGKQHDISVDQIIIEAGSLNQLPQLIKHYNGHMNDLTMICDENTYLAAGKKVEALLGNIHIIKLNPEHLHANEKAVELASSMLHENNSILIAVGSGTIHDITRYIAWKNNISFISVPTAASVDGFVSTVAAMTWYGFKKTLTAVAPICVVADTDIFSKAPYRLTASGISDLLGKHTAIADWKIAHLVTGEYICDNVCELENQALNTVCNNLTSIKNGDKDGYEQLMYGLILSGLAMQMIGNSRPASGAEHHFSHLWEMEIINSYLPYYHGEKVGVGLAIATKVYHETKDQIRKGISLKPYHGLETDLLSSIFEPKGLYSAILEENQNDSLESINPEELRTKLNGIADIIDGMPTIEEIINLLKTAGAPYDLTDIGLDESYYDLSVKVSCYVRNRLTFMRLQKLFEI